MKTKLSKSGKVYRDWAAPHARLHIERFNYAQKAYNDLASVGEVVSAQRSELAGSKLFTDAGRRAQLQKHVLRKAVPVMRYARDAVDRLVACRDKLRAAMIPKGFDKSDTVGFLRRQEYRARLARMTPSERATTLMGPNADPHYAEAAREMPADFSGISAELHAQLDAKAAAVHYPTECAEMADIDQAVAAIESVSRVATLDVSAETSIGARTLGRLIEADPALIEQTAAMEGDAVQKLIDALDRKRIENLTTRLLTEGAVANDDAA